MCITVCKYVWYLPLLLLLLLWYLFVLICLLYLFNCICKHSSVYYDCFYYLWLLFLLSFSYYLYISIYTQGSKSAWVVVHLYQDSIVECRLLDETLLQIAQKFKYIKFLKIKSTQAVENWPDRNLPTLFLYHDGELKTQLITLKEVGGKTMKLEGSLVLYGNMLLVYVLCYLSYYYYLQIKTVALPVSAKAVMHYTKLQYKKCTTSLCT